MILAAAELLERVASRYGLVIKQTLPVSKGYRNHSLPFITSDGIKLNLLIYKNEESILKTIKRANRVGDYLAAHEFPARKTYSPQIVEISGPGQTRLACLYEYLPGETIPWEAYTRRHLRLLGKSMASMHQILASYADVPEFKSINNQTARLSRAMKGYFAQIGVKRAMRQKLKTRIDSDTLESIQTSLNRANQLRSKQLLHMDFVRGNVLFEGTGAELRVSGVIDFEKVTVGHRLYDIARTLAFLYVDCKYKSFSDINKYFLYRGYLSERSHIDKQLSVTETNQLITGLVNFYLLHDFYKFLRHNPYESLSENRHYQRTVQLLLHKKLLQAV